MDIDDIGSIIEPEINRRMANNDFPGFGISIVDNGEIIYNYGTGYRDLDGNPFNADTLARFGSCTKSFTALAILLLEEQGKLSTSDPITAYLPTHPEKNPCDVTLHHLMAHTSGIPYYHIDGRNYGRNEIFELTALLIDGSYSDMGKFNYTNFGYSLLGLIIEEVTGRSYTDVISDLILRPLGMNRSLFIGEQEENSSDQNLALPLEVVRLDNQVNFVRSGHRHEDWVKPAGGLVTSCNEMVGYLDMIMSDGVVNDHPIFGQEMIGRLLEHHVKDEELTKILDVDSYVGYGFGVKDDYMGMTFINMAGVIHGGVSLVGMYKELGIGYACVWNSESSSQLFVYDMMDKIINNVVLAT